MSPTQPNLICPITIEVKELVELCVRNFDGNIEISAAMAQKLLLADKLEAHCHIEIQISQKRFLLWDKQAWQQSYDKQTKDKEFSHKRRQAQFKRQSDIDKLTKIIAKETGLTIELSQLKACEIVDHKRQMAEILYGYKL